MKKSQDEIIDQTLHGLRHTQPREGMERRILHALHSQPTPAPARFPWTWPLTTAAAILLTALLLNAHHHTTPSVTVGHNSGCPTLSRPCERVGVAANSATPSSEAKTLPSPFPTTLSSRPKRSAVERPASPTTHELSTQPRGVEASFSSPSHPTTEPGFSPGPTNEEARLLADLHAPSQPAPALPLTKEEKILRRIARHPDDVELAELLPESREAAVAADLADFQKHFYPPRRKHLTTSE